MSAMICITENQNALIVLASFAAGMVFGVIGFWSGKQ